MNELLIKAEDLKELMTFVNDTLPTKYGLPLLNFINAVAQKRAAESQAAVKEVAANEQASA